MVYVFSVIAGVLLLVTSVSYVLYLRNRKREERARRAAQRAARTRTVKEIMDNSIAYGADKQRDQDFAQRLIQDDEPSSKD
jgi:hypothetical protein